MDKWYTEHKLYILSFVLILLVHMLLTKSKQIVLRCGSFVPCCKELLSYNVCQLFTFLACSIQIPFTFKGNIYFVILKNLKFD